MLRNKPKNNKNIVVLVSLILIPKIYDGAASIPST